MSLESGPEANAAVCSLLKESLGHYAPYMAGGRITFRFCYECYLDGVFQGRRPLLVVPPLKHRIAVIAGEDLRTGDAIYIGGDYKARRVSRNSNAVAPRDIRRGENFIIDQPSDESRPVPPRYSDPLL